MSRNLLCIFIIALISVTVSSQDIQTSENQPHLQTEEQLPIIAQEMTIQVIGSPVEQTKEETSEKNQTDIASDVVFGSVIGSGVAAATNAISVSVIQAIGFGPTGIVAGSIAASVQSFLGLVEAGSFFSFLQSAGAAGSGILGVYAIPVIIGVGLAVGAYVLVNQLTQN